MLAVFAVTTATVQSHSYHELIVLFVTRLPSVTVFFSNVHKNNRTVTKQPNDDDRKRNHSTTVSELRRFIGMVNQLGKFTPKLTDLTQPLRELLSKTRVWTWGAPQEQAFAEV